MYQSAFVWYGHVHVACKSQSQCTIAEGGLQIKVAVALQAVSVLGKSAFCGLIKTPTVQHVACKSQQIMFM